MRLKVIFEPLAGEVQLPKRGTSESAGYDLTAHLSGDSVRVAIGGAEEMRAVLANGGQRMVALQPGERALIPLGFRARIPPGYHGEVRPRSGAAFRKGLEIPNSPGTIDSDYNGEWMVPVKNGDSRPITIEHGERIAQVVFVPHVSVEFERGTVERTTDRDGGFGSTGG
ncbi:MAG: dUTP diphosphatase [Gemmatimonadaceae bacterium]